MKKFLAAVLSFLLLAGTIGCAAAPASTDKTLNIVTTIFPIYDWVRQIVGDETDRVQITLLMDNGVDLHSYQPTAEDIVRICSCDLFLCVGGESDRWINDASFEKQNPNITLIRLLDILGDGAKEEELLEGMEPEEEGEDEDGTGPEFDEHVWLSLKNAALFCRAISDEICRLAPSIAQTCSANTEAYLAQLNLLDEKYQSAVAQAPVKTLLFGDRFPFRYLADDYGLTCYAAFAGCSAETEASFQTITTLANKVDELRLTAVLHIESSDGSVARTIRDATKTKDQRILTIDSLQSVTQNDIKNGVTYLSVMEQDLTVLKDALK